MRDEELLTDDELARTRYNFAQAKASLACEGMHLTAEEEALFESFHARRLSHAECRRRLIAYSRAKREAKAAVAASRELP